MAMVTVTSPCNTNTSQTFSLENNKNHLRDSSSSFSSYNLNVAEETFVLTVAKSSPNFNPFVANPNENLFLGGKKIEDGEIGVFDAKKYFNEESSKITKEGGDMKNNPPIDIAPVETKAQPRTPSVRSESSWNSQRALLQTSFRNPSRRKPNKAQGKNFFTHLGCKYCLCYDKNSVDIYDHAGENNSTKSSGTCGVILSKTISKEPIKNGLDSIDSARINDLGLGSKREECFGFPVLNCNTRNLAVKVKLQEEEEEKDGKPRNSLEVFGSPVLEKGKKSTLTSLTHHERKSKMRNWESSPRVEEETEIHSNLKETYNDTASDASSDLFEIESLTNSTGNHYLSRQESDGLSGCVTPTTCYAPSEASIEWSIVTGSVADFSVMSDSEDPSSISKTMYTNLKKVVPTAKTPHNNKEIQKRRTILLACKSHKAVRVAGEAYRTSEKAINDPRRCNGTDSFAPNTRFRAGSDPRNGRSISRT